MINIKIEVLLKWEEKNLIDQLKNLCENAESVKCVTIISTNEKLEKKILTDTTETNLNSGIYLIINCINNKFYPGSSFKLDTRYADHKRLLNKNKHHCYKLQQDWNKFGEENFEFHIVNLISPNDLGEEEQKYLDYCNINKESNYMVKNKSGRGILQSKLKNSTYQLVIEALKKTNGNRSDAARTSGISRRTIHRVIKRYNIKN